MTSTTAQDEITSYVEVVRAALAGLPEKTREELLEDLPEHLAEVQADAAGTLRDRLGAPEAYAAELRATAGLVGGFPEPPPPDGWTSVREAWAGVRKVLDRVDRRLGRLIGYELASDFLVLLRPAWWVLRGYLVSMVLIYVFDNERGRGLLPRFAGSDVLAVLLLAGCIGASILLGRRAGAWSRWPRYALRAATVFLVWFAFVGFVTADDDSRSAYYSPAGNYSTNPYGDVQDVYVYDAQGHLVQGARLFDQDGTPIQLGPGLPATCVDPQTGEATPSRSMGYPYCPQFAPFADPSASAAAPPAPQPSASAKPSLGALPSSSPSSSPSPTGNRPAASASAGG